MHPQKRLSLGRRLLSRALALPARLVPWHRLPVTLAIGTLWAFRNRLRQENLYSTSQLAPEEHLSTPGLRWLQRQPPAVRTFSSVGTDPVKPLMGTPGRRFGRNVPLHKALPDKGEALMTPNPREVSRKLLARDHFKPATTLNLLAAAWIQFQVHDWFEHEQDAEDALELPLPEGDTWPHGPIRVPRTRPAAPGVPGQEPPAFTNRRTHWWDASQIYGENEHVCASLRSHEEGKLLIGEDGLLPVDPETQIDRTGMTTNWWLGLSLLHTLFVREHNAVCEHLKRAYPHWSDEQLFQRARLINCALLAKIHSVEWTPAILGHPAVKIAMNANWTGLATQKVSWLLKSIKDREMQHGIPGSELDHGGVDYALTEEFAAVYRLHPLIPDKVRLRSLADPQLRLTKSMLELAGGRSREVQKALAMEDLFYSFGVSHPGAITLHNYPDFLRNLQPQPEPGVPTPPGPIDLAAIDILRDRERGVPRYNDFREALRMPRVKSFAQLTSNETWSQELESIYGNIDRVDLMVGLLAEEPPPGFGFSDTAFRIFILMASRRLKSDRFFTSDYNEATYTREGLAWINDNTMSTVLLRHYPTLAPVLEGVENAFAPWLKRPSRAADPR